MSFPVRAPLVTLVTLVALTGLPVSNAGAEPTRPWQSELSLSIRYSANDSIGGIRLVAGYVHPISRLSSRWGAYFMAGPYFEGGNGILIDNDGKASDPLRRLAVGAELRAGLAGCRGSWSSPGDCGDTRAPGRYFYLALTPMFSDAESAPGVALAEAGGAFGVRTALGVGLRSSWAYWLEKTTSSSSDDEFSLSVFNFLGWLLPNSFELSYEAARGKDESTHRFGGAFGYAF